MAQILSKPQIKVFVDEVLKYHSKLLQGGFILQQPFCKLFLLVQNTPNTNLILSFPYILKFYFITKQPHFFNNYTGKQTSTAYPGLVIW